MQVTQSDWHAVRHLVRTEGGEMTRRRANPDEVAETVQLLGDSLGVLLPGRVAVAEQQTAGTLSTVRFLALHGVEATLSRVRVAAAWDRDMIVHLMPIVDLHYEMPSSFEALARWERDGTVIGPPEAFRNGADPDSTTKIALVQAIAVARQVGKPISVNVSAHLVSDPTVLQSAMDTCDHLGVDRSLLSVELLENEPLCYPELLTMFSLWREAGFQIALDDFGSGYANAESARALRPNVIKTDIAVMRSMDKAVLSEAVAVAREIGATVTVEGIETKQQAEFARRLGADHGQGWLYGKAAKPTF